jgi:hypothetical protein
VFLINGQRNHSFDTTFVSNELEFKYIRNRTMIMVDLDGLKQEAIADIVNGSRNGLYEGEVYAAIRERVIATLKRDPDLRKEEARAEQAIEEATSGDEAVQKKLDELIEEHHSSGDHGIEGTDDPAEPGDVEGALFGKKLVKQQVVVGGAKGPKAEGPSLVTEGPILIMEPNVATLRLRPGVQRTVVVRSSPASEWANKTDVRIGPLADPALQTSLVVESDCGRVKLTYIAPDGFDEDEYPVKAHLNVFARFKGYEETRVLERDVIVVSPPPEVTDKPPRQPPVLTNDPKDLRVTSRQPVKLILGGPSTHVRLKWDGEDSLLLGSPPRWSITGRCTSMPNYPPITLGIIGGGKLELLMDTPASIAAKTALEFDVEAIGPSGRVLTTKFKGEVVQEENEKGDLPRMRKGLAPRLVQRKPNYRIIFVERKKYGLLPYWVGEWTDGEAGCFIEPKDDAPLTLCLNLDYAPFQEYRAALQERKLDAKVIASRQADYKSLLLFHLYQMYKAKKQRTTEHGKDEAVRIPEDSDLREESNRVALTIVRAAK